MFEYPNLSPGFERNEVSGIALIRLLSHSLIFPKRTLSSRLLDSLSNPEVCVANCFKVIGGYLS